MSNSQQTKLVSLHAEGVQLHEQRSLLRDAFYRFLQNRLAMLGLVLLTMLLLVALLADVVAPYG